MVFQEHFAYTTTARSGVQGGYIHPGGDRPYGRHFEEDPNARIHVQEQDCLANPSATSSPNQDLMVHNQGSMELFINCLHLALRVTNQQEVENSTDRQAEFCIALLIQSFRLVQLCRHTHQEEYGTHFVQLLQSTMRILNYLNQRRCRVWNNPDPSAK
ncbi:uncharacterized protein LOC144480033 [Mustelus asterias]